MVSFEKRIESSPLGASVSVVTLSELAGRAPTPSIGGETKDAKQVGVVAMTLHAWHARCSLVLTKELLR